MNEVIEIKKILDRETLISRASEYTYSFKNVQAIKTFGRDIYNDEINLNKADNVQSNLLVEIMNFKKKTNPLDSKKRQKR